MNEWTYDTRIDTQGIAYFAMAELLLLLQSYNPDAAFDFFALSWVWVFMYVLMQVCNKYVQIYELNMRR